MAQNNYVVQYRDGKWIMNAVGVPRMSTFDKKSNAVEQAKSKAKKFGNSKVEIYRKDGTLQDTVTYESKSGGASNGFLGDPLL